MSALFCFQLVWLVGSDRVIRVNFVESCPHSRVEIKRLLVSAGLSDGLRSSLTRFYSLANDHAHVKLLHQMNLSPDDRASVLSGSKQVDIILEPEETVRLYYFEDDGFANSRSADRRSADERTLVCMRH